MMEHVQAWKKKRQRLWLALALLVALLAVVFVPPLVSMSRYKSRITHLMSESLGRPVRLSSVELRLFPVPGFVLTDLTVEEDPAYGAEPVLHADTVTASIRLWSLWRGRMEIGTISVDEASLNVVRTAEGRWNLDPLFRTAAAKAQPEVGGTNRHVTPLPYLEATNSRINFKRGAEKLPFSLVETDLSFWQEQPGDWRIRLRGQPARTDLSLDPADTGLVRLEARIQTAPELRRMPVHLDLQWQEAQLGQLTRLLIGSDTGWRGDLTGELHLDGTADAAQIQTRLRATGVHRAEFAPAAPMDFDATCGFLYHFSRRALENLACDSPLGDGRIHLAGDIPGNGDLPRLSVELDRIPVAAGLDALRTVRSDFGPGLEASGSISGKISYAPATAAPVVSQKQAQAKLANKARMAKTHPAMLKPLTGGFTVEGFELSGGGLSTPIQASKLTLEPVIASVQNLPLGHSPINVQHAALETTVTFPAGGASPLTVNARLARAGYQLTMHGQASVARARELAHVAGMAAALDSLAGDPVSLDLVAAGPWLPAESIPFAGNPAATAAADAAEVAMGARLAVDAASPPVTDTLSGTVTLRNANWKADYLANHVEIAQTTLHLDNGNMRWDPVVFSYGPVKGTASLNVPAHCDATQQCGSAFLATPSPTAFPITFKVQLGDLNASALQAAILGAHEPGTLLSTVLARLRPADTSSAPAWPTLEGTVKADSLILGPVTLTGATATMRIVDRGAEITGLDANLLGGHVRGGGTLRAAVGPGKPAYTLEGHFQNLSPARVGQLLGLKWSGGVFEADGKVDLSGFTDKDLAASAKGTLQFEWRHGAVAVGAEDSSTAGGVPEALARFDRWAAAAAIADGTVTLKESEVQQGSRKRAIDAALTFGDPPKVSFVAPKEAQAKR